MWKNTITKVAMTQTCPYYDKLKILFGRRPRATSVAWGYDSGNADSSRDDGVDSPAATSDDGESTPRSSGRRPLPKYKSG